MRYFIYLLTFVLLAGCSHNLFTSQVRPDQLRFPPLEFHFPEVTQQELKNGMKLYLKEDHELPLVELTLLVDGGSIYDPLEQTGLSQFFAQTLSTGGTLRLTPAALEGELEELAAILTVSSSFYGYEINLSLNRDDLQRGVEILADLVQRPRFDPERMELVRRQMLEIIQRKNDDPGSIADRILENAVNSGHPFGTYPTATAIAAFSRDDLLELHQHYFKPQNFWLAVSGDVKREELISLLQQQFGERQTIATLQRNYPLLPSVPEGKIFLIDKDIPQTTILMGHVGICKDNPDVLALQVANYILGGGGFNSRMMREVRSNRGLAYSVYTQFQVGRHLPGLFIAGSETKTTSTVEVVILMRQLIEQMREEPVTDAELELAKKSLINSFVFAFSDAHAVVRRKVRLDYYGYPKEYLETYRQKIEEVTIADVQRVARQYLRPDKLQIVLVGNSDDYSDGVRNLGLLVEDIDLH